MTRIHIRDPQGAPLCGQTQAYRSRPLEEWRKTPDYEKCKRCAKAIATKEGGNNEIPGNDPDR